MTGFGFETPAWLGALAVIAPLAWLYLRRRRRPPAIVSSLVVWRTVAKRLVPRKEARLPLLFFVQALLVIAGATAAAGPFASKPKPPGPPRDAVVVLDVSASMQAKLASGTRFDAARDAAAARARALADEGRRITVIAAALQPQLLGTGLGGPEAADLLSRLHAVDTAGNLTAAAELAATRAGGHGSVDLFTDTALDQLVMSRDARAATSVHRFGAGGTNLAIAAVRVETNPFEERARSRVLVTVRSFADEPRAATVEIAPLDPAAGKALQHPVSLAPNASEVLTFDAVPWSGPFAARLLGGDDLPLDDVGYGWVPPRRPLQVAVVTEDPGFARALESLLKKVGDAVVRTVAPAAYRPEVGGEITVFDRTAPAIPPAGNVLYLAPQQGNPDVSIVGEASAARFAEQRDHELLRGVQNPETLLSGHLVGLAAGGPLKPVLLGRAEGREAALALAGDVGGRRVVATAFAIRPGSLSDPDALPAIVFTLNAVRWLSPTSDAAPLQRTAGERLRAGSAGDPAITRIVGPGGARELGPTEEVTLERAGVYETVAPARTRPLLVSFVDPTESDIRRAAASPDAPAVVPAERAEEPVATGPATTEIPYAREALLALIALMLLEWAVVAASARAPRHTSADPDADDEAPTAAHDASGGAAIGGAAAGGAGA
ncbi:MAG TPA: BatA domain-containing protein [Candidatus Binatia bacterium]|nr:BatA domain-containing protein [Candidatus Binatia bacterium]